MFAGRYGLAGEPDDLVIAPHRVPWAKRTRGDFVAGWNQAAYGKILKPGTTDQLASGDHNVVVRVKSDKWVHGSGFLRWVLRQLTLKRVCELSMCACMAKRAAAGSCWRMA